MAFFTIILMFTLTGAEVDLFIPSFPEMKEVFNLSPFMVELTLAVNLFAHCCTSLVVGTLGDKYGRKSIILIGLILFIIASILCANARVYEQLLIGRFLQGVGISGPAVLSYLIIMDNYPKEKQQELLGILNGLMTLAMAFAPVVGSYVSLIFHWQGNFVALLSLGIICFIFGLFFIPADSINPKDTTSSESYIEVLKNPKAINYIFLICFMAAPYWVFISLAPILYVEDLGVSLEHFGLYQGSLALTFSLASFVSSPLIRKFGEHNCLLFGFSGILLTIIGIIILILLKVHDPLIITLLMLFASIVIIFPINILYPLSLTVIPTAKGKVSAMIVSLKMVLTAASIQITSYFYDKSFAYIGIMIVLLNVILFYFVYKLNRLEKNSLFFPKS